MAKFLNPKVFGIFLIGTFALFFGTHCGELSITMNQNIYLLAPIKIADPLFALNDWYVEEVFQHHFFFNILVGLLLKVFSLKLVLQFGLFIQSLSICGGVYLLTHQFFKRTTGIYFLIIAWLILVNQEIISIGGRTFISGYFQPSSMADALIFLGLCMIICGKYQRGTFVSVFGGCFHFAYVSATSFIVGLFPLIKFRPFKLKETFKFYLPCIALWGSATVYLLYYMKSAPAHTGLGSKIATHIRTPEEFLISYWDRGMILSFIGWNFLGVIAFFRNPLKEKLDNLMIIWPLTLVIVIAGPLLQYFFDLAFIRMLMLHRISPMLTIFSMIVFIGSIVDRLVVPYKNWIKELFVLFCFGICYLSFARYGWMPYNPMNIVFLLYILAFYYSDLLKIESKFQIIKVTPLILGVLLLGRLSLLGAKRIMSTVNAPLSPKQELGAWVDKNIPNGSVFLTPPLDTGMRTQLNRAIVTDWQSSAYIASELEEWLNRLLKITKLKVNELKIINLNSAYHNNTLEQFVELQKLFHFNYLIIHSDKIQFPGLNLVYQNNKYSVLTHDNWK